MLSEAAVLRVTVVMTTTDGLGLMGRGEGVWLLLRRRWCTCVRRVFGCFEPFCNLSLIYRPGV